jgi:GAF domain-containing protein
VLRELVAFYVANPKATALHHLIGIPEDYAKAVDGFEIGPNSLACGLAAYSCRPVLTTDVAKDPRWATWTHMADRFGYRGCWSFPIRTSVGGGTLAIYSGAPREANRSDVEYVGFVVQSAAILVDRHLRMSRSADTEKVTALESVPTVL